MQKHVLLVLCCCALLAHGEESQRFLRHVSQSLLLHIRDTNVCAEVCTSYAIPISIMVRYDTNVCAEVCTSYAIPISIMVRYDTNVCAEVCTSYAIPISIMVRYDTNVQKCVLHMLVSLLLLSSLIEGSPYLTLTNNTK